MRRTKTVAEALSSGPNGLNGFRLGLAVLVIAIHSFGLLGVDIYPARLDRYLREVVVDSFFAISGYLILASWSRNPAVLPYLRARMARIFPAYLVCLAVLVSVIAPIGILVGQRRMPENYVPEAVRWFFGHLFLRPFGASFDIARTPEGIPYPGVWNGSLWTLQWEFYLYLAVLAGGVIGLFRWRLAIPLVWAGAYFIDTWVNATNVTDFDAIMIGRLGLVFASGMLVFWAREHLPVSSVMIFLAASLVAGSYLLPNYRLIGALPLAYLIIAGSTKVHRWGFSTRFDMSYGTYIYAFPVQQALVLAGIGAVGPWGFMLASLALTLPLAALSWRYIERPALRWARGPDRAPALGSGHSDEAQGGLVR